MYWAFILNPVAGNGHAKDVMLRLEEKLKQSNLSYRLFQTEYAGHGTRLAAELAAEEQVEKIIAVGGDGTVAEVAAGMIHTGKPMGVIPAGTGNDFIKSAGIPADPVQALDFIFQGVPKKTDTGTVSDRFFLNVCGTGFDVTVLDYAESEKKKHRGLTPYFLGLLKAIFHYRSVELTVTCDGQTEAGRYLVCSIANGRYIGGGIPICPAADISDGLLDLVLIQHRHRWQIPFYLPGLMLSRDLHFRITTHRRCREVRIEGKNLRINTDGDIQDLSVATFKINPASLLLIR